MQVPYRENAFSEKVTYRDIVMFDPHELLSFLWNKVGVHVPQAVIDDYWSSAKQNGLPGAQDLPTMQPQPIPLKLFGDDCTYNGQQDKCLGLVLSCPLWRPRRGRHGRWPIAVLSMKNWLGEMTVRPVMQRIVWSLNLCFHESISNDGHHFIITELGGDWKYQRECFSMRSHWNSPKCCHLCSTPRDQITDLADDLPFRDMEDFMNEILPSGGNWPPLILLEQFHPSKITWCLLHVLYLGLLWTANGASLTKLLELGWFGEPGMDLRLKLLAAHARFRSWLKNYKLQSSQRPFTVGMLFKASHGAYLAAKGFNSRLMAAWLAAETQEQLSTLGDAADDELVLQASTMCLHAIGVPTTVFHRGFESKGCNLNVGAHSRNLRLSIARYMDLSERSPRFLTLS